MSPLDIFANSALKTVLREKDVSTIVLLKRETAKTIASLSKDDVFRAQLAKACRAFEKRARWVAANAGRKVNRQEANEQWCKWMQHFAPDSFVAENEKSGRKKRGCEKPAASVVSEAADLPEMRNESHGY